MDKHTIVFRNDLSEISRLHDYFVNIGREADIDEATLDSINLAVEEAVVNVISYAYPADSEGTVTIHFDSDDNGHLIRFVISDHGKPFDPTRIDGPDISLPAEERPVGGLGIHLVRSLMDDLAYTRTDDGRNVLTLTKRI